MDRKVFRLRQIPLHMKERDVSNMLEGAFGLDHSAVRIFSLARNVDVWMPSQTATLMFQASSASLDRLLLTGQDEWKFSAVNIRPDPILDTHFRGLTALNEPANHAADCIAISGLAGHPFGSWQRKGAEKTFMWIRDDLPQALPRVRFILYGYDSTLPSDSFQRIPDLSQALLQQLQANGWTLSTCKPLLFLAHSLGGLVLKQALVTLANHPGTLKPLQDVIRGAVCFGVPNFGMEQEALLSMVEGRPNNDLIAELAPRSEYLSTLHEQMHGIAFLQGVKLFWAYETQESPTVRMNEAGRWSRSGPKTVLVTPDSATGGLYDAQGSSDSIFPVNEDHSNMVKFAPNDANSTVVRSKLDLLLGQIGNNIAAKEPLSPVVKSQPANFWSLEAEGRERRKLTLEERIIRSLDAPGLRDRIEIIENKHRDTFDWIYETEEPGFIKWLRTGSGIFWINGKPGSGKSTLMKLIATDKRTNYLIQSWRSNTRHFLVSFFFNHRGTPIQKSFEGLLRGLLAQILEKENRLLAGVRAKFPSDVPSDATIASISQSWTLDRLRQWLRYVLEQSDIPLRLTLVLDALDEFDGSKEFICEFLKDITVPKNVKVCFSSRPWDIFVTNFGSRPGFRLQDFTQHDIRSYCLGSLQSVVKLAPVVEEVVLKMTERARGVFLWIKLVIKDLEAAESNGELDDVVKLLDAIPNELDEYFLEIIHRIPVSHRSKTYMALEMVARSREPLAPDRLAIFVEVLPDPQQWGSSRRRRRKLKKDKRTTKRLLSTYCGGLLEIIEAPDIKAHVQVIHQTVMDFVTDVRFKQRVLGDQAILTTDNGHSSLAKQGILHLGGRWPGTDNLYHAQMAERTTGRSLKKFIDTEAVQKRMAAGKAIFSSPMELAAKFLLPLYMTESLEQDRDFFRNCKEPVLSWIVNDRFTDRGPYGTQRELVELALARGYNIAYDPKCLRIAILECQRASRRGPLDLARLLLESGAEVNSPYRTALDALIVKFDCIEQVDWYDMAMEVAQRGGKLRHVQERKAENVLNVLERLGAVSTPLLREACLPASYFGYCTGFTSVGALSIAVLRKLDKAKLTPEWLGDIVLDEL